MLEKLVKIRQEAMEQILSASSADSLNDLRVRYLGKKGLLTEVLKGMKDVSAEERPRVGQLVNDARKEIENNLDSMRTEFENRLMQARLQAEEIDVTLPGKKNTLGHSHPNNEIGRAHV